MSMNYDGPNRTTGSETEDEGLLFAPIPAWERGKKRRGFGGTKSAKTAAPTISTTTAGSEPRSFETTDSTTYRDDRAATAATAAGAGMTGAGAFDSGAIDTRTGFAPSSDTVIRPATTATADADAGIAAPIGRRTTTTTSRKSGVPGAAVAVGVLALAGLGAAGWYMSQDNNDSVAELTPGMTDTSATALATATPNTTGALPPPVAAETRTTQMAAAEPVRTPARAEATTTTRRTTTTRTAAASRTRPAATSATEAGINASGTATLPAGPQPYSTLSGTTAGTATVTTPAPTATPPVTEQPAPIPSTPPVSADPAPQPVNPVTPETPTPDPTATPK